MKRLAGFTITCLFVAFLLVRCAQTRRPATPSPTSVVVRAVATTPAASRGTQPVARTQPSPTVPPSVAPTRIPGQGPLVALDPGHGGEDLGARHFKRDGQMDFYESTITLQLALRIGARLEALGYRVFYTRDGDYDPNLYERDVTGDGEINLRDVVQTRTDLVNESGADILISLHLNAWECDDEELWRATGGTETYYCPDRPFGDRNLRLATLVHQNILAALRRLGHEPSDRGVMIDHAPAYPGDPGNHLMILGPKDEIIVRPSNMPGILSEPVFITCDAEAYLIIREDAQDALAQAYVDAIVQYFKEYPLP
ncbi:MAG: N-acetylmuramoyl-L-alanine amidase [Anaerolineae bacterium]|nr:N-acetylmuramoyl-L-alanine amidase [Anaerolineae bacterium]